MPHLDRAAERQDRQRDREDGGERLRDHEQHALGVAVRDHAAEQPEQQHGRELHRDRDPDGGDAAGELEDEPVLRDALHPDRGRRDDVPDVKSRKFGTRSEEKVSRQAGRSPDDRHGGGGRRRSDGGVGGRGHGESQRFVCRVRVVWVEPRRPSAPIHAIADSAISEQDDPYQSYSIPE